MKIQIATASVKLIAELDDTKMTKLVLDALPCTSEANTWGEEVYFDLPINGGRSR